MEQAIKKDMESAIEDMIYPVKQYAQLYYNDGWDELIESYTDDDIFNILCINKVSNLDDAIQLFHYRFNPNSLNTNIN